MGGSDMARKIYSLLAVFVVLLIMRGCSINFAGHTNWVGDKVPNGQIILVRKGASSYGAFIPTSQRMGPDRVKFAWYYREDGKGTFKPTQSAQYKTGTGVGVPDGSVPWLMVRFGPFSVGWSGHQDGEGSLYYSRIEGQAVLPDDVRICVTAETDIRKIDAADPKWVYKGSPTDPGIHGGTSRP
jgi:hypothetical protein